jgi:hypothetical protein
MTKLPQKALEAVRQLPADSQDEIAEAAMRKFLLVLAALAAVTLLGSSPSQAYYGTAPWCAVVNLGHGSVVQRCVYWDFETCRQNVIAGNRGFCNTNPYFAGRGAASPRLSRKRVRY